MFNKLKEKTVEELILYIEDLEDENQELSQEKEDILSELMEAKERIEYLERDLDNMKESRDEVKDDLDELKSKFEDLEEENSNLYERSELLDCLENWREIIADRNDDRSTEIYDRLCDLIKSFNEYPLEMARLYRENPSEELDKVLDEKILEALRCKGAALLNRFGLSST